MKKLILICFVLFTAGWIAGCSANQPAAEEIPAAPSIIPSALPTSTAKIPRSEINIPVGTPAVIDGQIDPGEWENAAKQELSDGSQMYLMYAEDALYLAVDAKVQGIVNLGVLRNGELWILHSSAALGSAVFQLVDQGWRMSKTYDWCCRMNSSEVGYQNLLATEGWLSTNQYQGDTKQTEFLVQIPVDEITIAVTYLFMDGSGTSFWPQALPETDLLMFSSPPQVGDLSIFTTEEWVKFNRSVSKQKKFLD